MALVSHRKLTHLHINYRKYFSKMSGRTNNLNAKVSLYSFNIHTDIS